MKDLLLSFLLLAIEVLGLYLFLDVFLVRRKRELWQTVLLYGIQCACNYGLAILFNHYSGAWMVYPLKFLVFVMTDLAIIELKYYGKLWEKIFYPICYLTVILLMDSFWMVGINIWNPGILDTFEGMTVFSLSCKCAEYLIMVLINRSFDRKNRTYEIDRKIWNCFSWFPVFSILAASLFFAENMWTHISVLIVIFGLFLSNLLLFFLLDNYARKESENRELLVRQEQALRQEELYGSIRNSYYEQRARAHEFQEYLKAFGNLLEEDKVQEAEEYVREVMERVERQHKYFNTSNAVLDALINEKYRQAKQEGIALSVKLADVTRLGIAEEKLAVFLAAVIDLLLRECRQMHRKLARFGIEEEEEEWRIMAEVLSGDTEFTESEQAVWKKEFGHLEVLSLPEERNAEVFVHANERVLAYCIIL